MKLVTFNIKVLFIFSIDDKLQKLITQKILNLLHAPYWLLNLTKLLESYFIYFSHLTGLFINFDKKNYVDLH